MSLQSYRKFTWAGLVLAFVVIIGTIGFGVIGKGEHSFVDALYMTVITISTIGYGEVIDLSNNPAGRIFAIFIALSGIGTLFYILTSFTALMVEGELTKSFRRRRMVRKAKNSKEHYIVCGAGRIGFHIADELKATKRPFVIVDISRNSIEEVGNTFQDDIFLEGDATDSDTLLRAGIQKAKGLFAATGDDNQNLVITLTAKQINQNVRVIARCKEMKHVEKTKKAGADAVISSDIIGGLRMASEMIRPTVVSFLDVMLRDREKNVRVEEILVPDSFNGKTISDLNLRKQYNALLLAVKMGEDWIYNPPDDYIVTITNILVFLTTPQDRLKLERFFHTDK